MNANKAPSKLGGAGGRRIGVLLSEGSSSSSRQAIYCLAKRFRVGVLDPGRLCQSRFSRHVKLHRCPHFAEQPRDYLRFAADTMRRHDYKVLLPTHDQVYLLSRFKRRLESSIRCPLPEFEALKRLQSKVAFHQLLCQLELPCPDTKIIDWPERPSAPLSFPYYVKADHGTAGGGVRFVKDQPQLHSALEELARAGLLREGSRYMIQEPCVGKHSVVQSVFRHGEMLAVHCAETQKRGVGGGQGLRTSVEHPTVVDHILRLGRYLNWHGPLFLEYFYDAHNDRPAYIEANPRIGETLNAMLSGVNLCQLIVEMTIADSTIEPLSPGKIGTRSHVDFLLLLAGAMEGLGRVKLMGMLLQMMRHSGPFGNAQNEMTRLKEDWMSLIPAAAAAAQVLLLPSLAQKIVVQATRRCGLTDSAAHAIDSLSNDELYQELFP